MNLELKCISVLFLVLHIAAFHIPLTRDVLYHCQHSRTVLEILNLGGDLLIGIIKNNIIGSRQNTGGSGAGIFHDGDGDDLLSKVIDNRITCATDGIQGFTTGNVQGNIVSVDGDTPAAETA